MTLYRPKIFVKKFIFESELQNISVKVVSSQQRLELHLS